MSRTGSGRSTKSARSVTWSTAESDKALVTKEGEDEEDDMVDQAARAAKAKVKRFGEIFSGE